MQLAFFFFFAFFFLAHVFKVQCWRCTWPRRWRDKDANRPAGPVPPQSCTCASQVIVSARGHTAHQTGDSVYHVKEQVGPDSGPRWHSFFVVVVFLWASHYTRSNGHFGTAADLYVVEIKRQTFCKCLHSSCGSTTRRSAAIKDDRLSRRHLPRRMC